MTEPEVRYEVEGNVAHVVLNRPDRMNALTVAMARLVEDVLLQAERDPDVRCIVLSGAGSAFCSGDDTSQWSGPGLSTVLEDLSDARPRVLPPMAALLDCRKPVICAVNGPALGAGMDLALLCDIRIASEAATFGQLFVKFGLSSYVGGLWALPQLVGPSMAAELLFTGRTIDARTALAVGLVSRVTSDVDLGPAATSLAIEIAANPPLAVRYLKEGLRRGMSTPRRELPELAAFAANSLARLLASEDHHNAVRALRTGPGAASSSTAVSR